MTKRTFWQDENGEPTIICMIISAVLGVGGFYAFFILMCLLEEILNA